ncbi:hypothetical protein [Caulobacter sp. 17J80-11]|uniref:hypothetical protein n=1 Tax=Caulobacter sp. 17J80-11 TaxID=2763502 RepID=UPI001653ED1C|nr:hypothetical protein [Caulobacter sp. 17J80-11]MBC6982153.1 hypothetical protein [Caulobacter sp. 17J80-11]
MVGIITRHARTLRGGALAAVVVVLSPAAAFAQNPPITSSVPADYNAELCLRINAGGVLASTGKADKAAALLLNVCAPPVERATLLEFNTALLAEAGEAGAAIRVDPVSGELRLADGAGPGAEQRLADLRGRAPAQLPTSARLQAFALQAVKDAKRGR